MSLKTSSWRMLRDALVVALVAVLTVQGLRRWYGDRYLVPSDSMQPMLYGHPEHGDVVFVDKLASAAELRRGDLVVVEHENHPGHQLVKRIAARGDDKDFNYINILKGDIWLGKDAQSMQREVKDPLTARDQQVLWAELAGRANDGYLDMSAARPGDNESGNNESGGDDVWRLPAAIGSVADARTMFRPRALLARRAGDTNDSLPKGFLGTARPLDATYLDRIGNRSLSGEDVAVSDCSMEVVLARPSSVEVLATIEMPGEALTFHWQPATGRVVLWRNGIDVAAGMCVVREPSVIEFGRLDDRAWFCLDRARESLFLVPRKPEWQPEHKNGLPIGPRALLHLGVLGGESAGLEISALRVRRDIFSWRQPVLGLPGQTGAWPRWVPPGEWFLLGDNAFDSRDSRQFKSVSVSTFLGVPRCVLGPWSRRRWLVR